jgi:hypothetical protein
MRVIIWFLIGIWNNKPIGVPVSKKTSREIEHHLVLRWVTIADCPGFETFPFEWHQNLSYGGQPSIPPTPLHVIHQSCYPKRVPKLFHYITFWTKVPFYFKGKSLYPHFRIKIQTVLDIYCYKINLCFLTHFWFHSLKIQLFW